MLKHQVSKRFVDLDCKWQLPYFFRPPPAEKIICVYISMKTTFEHFQATLGNLMGLDGVETEAVELSTVSGIDAKFLQRCKDHIATVLPSAEISVCADMNPIGFSMRMQHKMLHLRYHHSLMN